jgi:predicted dehydrogenase
MSLRVGIVGYGDIAQYHARHLTAAGACVVAAVTTRPLPPDIRRYPSLSAMLADVDAVTIAVPNNLHASLCLEAVAARTAVFVEKPLCIAQAEMHALEAMLPQAARPVHVGYRLRWNPSLRALRSGVARVRRVRCVYRLGIERLAAGKPWTRREAASGGAFCAIGVHALDLARWLARADGRPLENLRADATHRAPGADFPLLTRLEGRIAGGPCIEAAADLRGDCEFHLELELDAERGAFSEHSLSGLRPEEAGAADAEYSGMMKHFVEAATHGHPASDEIGEILECHREILAARQLATTAHGA